MPLILFAVNNAINVQHAALGTAFGAGEGLLMRHSVAQFGAGKGLTQQICA